MSSPRRRLAALLVTDIVGYTARSSEDEDRALQLVHLFQKESRRVVGRFGGRIVKFLGDGLLGEFKSVDDALYSAQCLHAELATRTTDRGLDDVQLRSAVHLGEIFAAADGDIYGEGVNLAARLQELADPGEIVTSGDVWRQIHQRQEFHFDSFGRRTLKGIALPVEIFRVVPAREWSPLPLARGEREHASIAVLPFVDMGSELDDQHFTDGITEDVIAAIAKIRSVRVTSRTSIMRYRNSNKGPREIARELGVATLLEGSVRRAGSRVRVVVQLFDPDTDEHLWTETYDRGLIDLLGLQAEIAERVADALRTTLTPDERRGIEAGRTRDLSAFELYLKGRSYLYRILSGWSGEQSMAQAESAIELFEAALERDPNYARAHAGIALAYNEMAGAASLEGAIGAGLASARRAISLAPELSDGHGALGCLHATAFELSRAIDHLRRAVAIDSNDAYVIHELVWCASQLGDLVEALRWAERAVAIEPHEGTHFAFVGRLLTHLGAFREAEGWFRAGLAVEPDNACAFRFQASLFLLEGQQHEANELIERGLARRPGAAQIEYTAGLLALLDNDYSRSLYHYERVAEEVNEEFRPLVELGYVRGKLGDQRRASGYLERANERARAHVTREGWWRHRYDLVAVQAILGNREEAIGWLADAVGRGWLPFRRTRIDPFFESLSDDPRFNALLDQSESVLDRMGAKAWAQGLIAPPES